MSEVTGFGRCHVNGSGGNRCETKSMGEAIINRKWEREWTINTERRRGRRLQVYLQKCPVANVL